MDTLSKTATQDDTQKDSHKHIKKNSENNEFQSSQKKIRKYGSKNHQKESYSLSSSEFEQSKNSSSSNDSTSKASSSSSDSYTKRKHTKNRGKRTKVKAQRILGEFKFERYNGQSDPKIWFKGFENKATLYDLFDKENKKLLQNELYILMSDKAREFFEEKKLIKQPYK